MKCDKCGTKLKLIKKSCPNCGKDQTYRYVMLLINIVLLVSSSISFIWLSKYRAMALIAFFAYFNISCKACSKQEYNSSEILSLIVFELLGIIIGAKIFSYISNYPNTKSFMEAGMSAYGALIGTIVMIGFYEFIYRKDIFEILRIILVPVPLVYAIGKIGCMLTGCCYGMNYSGFLHINYAKSIVAPNGVDLFPIQPLETICFSLAFIILYKLKVKDKTKCGLIFVICGMLKFVLDYLRAGRAEVLSVNQKTSIVFVIIGIIFLIIKGKKAKKEGDL